MGWSTQDVASSGQYLMAHMSGGWAADMFDTVSHDDLLSRLREYAAGWTPSAVRWERGVFGIGSSLRIFGRADSGVDVFTASAGAEVEAAVNSFWTIGRSKANVYVSDTLTVPAEGGGGQWAGAIKFASVAVIVIGGVYVFATLKSK